MYRVNVLSKGKCGNTALGYRYCLTKKSAKTLIDDFLDSGCSIEVEKWIRIYGDLFCWTDWVEGDKVFDYYADKMYEIYEAPGED